MIAYELAYAAVCISFAYLNARWIKQGKKIKHGWNGLLHAAAGTVAGFLFGWLAVLIVLLNSRAVFDTALNLFRGLPLGYVSSKPASIVDRLEKWVFGTDGITPKVLYIVVSMVLHIWV